MKIVNIQKGPTWTSLITSLKMHETLNAPYESMRSITSLISGTLRIKYPDLFFTTSKEVVTKGKKLVTVLVIKRIKEEEFLQLRTKKAG